MLVYADGTDTRSQGALSTLLQTPAIVSIWASLTDPDAAPLLITCFPVFREVLADLLCKTLCSPLLNPRNWSLSERLSPAPTKSNVLGVHSNTTDSRKASCSQNCRIAKQGLPEQVEHEAALLSRFVALMSASAERHIPDLSVPIKTAKNLNIFLVQILKVSV